MVRFRPLTFRCLEWNRCTILTGTFSVSRGPAAGLRGRKSRLSRVLARVFVFNDAFISTSVGTRLSENRSGRLPRKNKREEKRLRREGEGWRRLLAGVHRRRHGLRADLTNRYLPARAERKIRLLLHRRSSIILVKYTFPLMTINDGNNDAEEKLVRRRRSCGNELQCNVINNIYIFAHSFQQ